MQLNSYNSIIIYFVTIKVFTKYIKMCHCKPPQKRIPDLKFSYNLKDKNTIFSKQLIGSTLLEFINGNLYNKENSVVGQFSITNTIYNIDNANVNNLYELTSQATFFLPKGTIQILTATQVKKNSEGIIVVPPGKTIFKILTGTKTYINASGYVVINNIANTLNKHVSIYFTK